MIDTFDETEVYTRLITSVTAFVEAGSFPSSASLFSSSVRDFEQKRLFSRFWFFYPVVGPKLPSQQTTRSRRDEKAQASKDTHHHKSPKEGLTRHGHQPKRQ